MPSNHLILCHPFLLPLIFPSTRVFPNKLALRIWDFCFGPAASSFLELLVLWIALPSSPVAYWTPSDWGGSSSDVIFFCLFEPFMGFLPQEYWHGLPFSLPVDHILSELSTMTCPSWVALHGMAYSFITLYKPLCHKTRLWSMKRVKMIGVSKNHHHPPSPWWSSLVSCSPLLFALR